MQLRICGIHSWPTIRAGGIGLRELRALPPRDGIPPRVAAAVLAGCAPRFVRLLSERKRSHHVGRIRGCDAQWLVRTAALWRAAHEHLIKRGEGTTAWSAQSWSQGVNTGVLAAVDPPARAPACRRADGPLVAAPGTRTGLRNSRCPGRAKDRTGTCPRPRACTWEAKP